MKSPTTQYTTLKQRFFDLAKEQIDNTTLISELWRELEELYGNKNRHYHNLSHLENLFTELFLIKNDFEDFETIAWSVFYHDAIYNVRKKDNEEKSAEMAVNRLRKINYPIDLIQKCKAQISATKSHTISKNNDTNLFTDADLSILGKDWNTYTSYFNAIRNEYKIYPNLLYKPARKKVLLHFLEMPSIFKTDYFKNRYEKQALSNIKQEINLL